VELQILNVLWDRGPSSVGQIHRVLRDQRHTGYSTTLKMVQVMTQKGLLAKDDSRRPQIFTPAMTQEDAQTGLVDDLLQRAFAGAVDKLVMRALDGRSLSRDELKAIKKLLRQHEEASK
jgi:predicted transcriptional regulator